MDAAPASLERHANEKRFEDFFREDTYIQFKNLMYNYRLRKRAVEAAVKRDNPHLVLEVGSGLSPMMTHTDAVVFSELSFQALKTLKKTHGHGHYVVADGTRLPFKDGSFTHGVCSEVLEHIENDTAVLGELSRIVEPGGEVCITVPKGKYYFAADDRYVGHFRRYSIQEVLDKLAAAGLRPRAVHKVLGPLEKVTMFSAVMFFSLFVGRGPVRSPGTKRVAPAIEFVFEWANLAYACLAWLDAKIMPLALTTVILVEARKPEPGSD